MRRSAWLAGLAGALWLLSCVGQTPNSGIGQRQGARGRITGYLYEADTGAGLDDVKVETIDNGNKVAVTSSGGGFYTLDNLLAGASYRITMSKDGYVPRILQSTIPQVGTDTYDAIAVANTGSVVMVKPEGTIKGRVEYGLPLNPGQGIPIVGANVIADYSGNGGQFGLTVSATTSATGEFTLTGLPASPFGISSTVCVYALNSDMDGVADFQPTCVSVNVYPNQVTPMVLRPTRYDITNQDANLISGVVTDVLSRLPVAGVQVSEVGKESQGVSTDANGFYLLRTDSVDRFIQVIFHKAPYADGYREYNLSRGTNNQSQNLQLLPSGASLVGQLYYANFLPAKQAEIRIDLRTSNAVNVFQTVKTDDLGNFTLDNLPGQADGMNVNLRVTPWSADPDLFPETQPQSINVTLYPAAKTELIQQLLSNASLQVVATNVTTGFIATTDPFTLEATLPTVPTDNTFTLTDNSIGGTMPFTVSYADSNRRVTLTPVVATGSPLWSEAHTYSVQARLRANNGPSGFIQPSFSFSPRTSLMAANISGKIASVTVDTPDIDATTRQFTLRWPPLPDAFGYSVYARTSNTSRVPSYVRITTANAAQSPSASVNMNAATAFDSAQGQAFAYGQIVSFLVVPVDSRGIETDATKGATLDLKDNVPPRINLGIAQLDGAAGSTHDVRFIVNATEGMDRNNPPTTSLPSGLTFKSWVVDETTGGTEGFLTLTGSLASVANLSVQALDTSGNVGRAVAVPVLQTTLLPSNGFEGSPCSMTGWQNQLNATCAACMNQVMPTQPAGVTDVPGVLSAFEGTCAMQMGDPDTTWCGQQETAATLDLTGATFNNRSLFLQYRFWAYNTTNPVSGFVHSKCDFVEQMIPPTTTFATFHNVTTNNNQRVWQTLSTDLTSQIGRIGRFRCTLDTSNQCGQRGGVQLDDFRIYMK